MEFVTALLNYEFLENALIACILASIGCGIIGSFVVVKRIGFLAGGIAHTVLAGMGIAYFLGGSPFVGAVMAAVLAGGFIGWIHLRWKQDEDILIAAFWSVGMAVGILFISRTPGYSVDLMSYLFGNILLVSDRDLGLMFILDIVIVITIVSFFKQFLAVSFDEEFARLRGINVERFYILLMCLVALTVVLLIQIVGLILVIALLTLPSASARQITGSVLRMMIVSVLLSVFITIGGLAISYGPDLPAGAMIVVTAGMVYALFVISARLIQGKIKI
ncbi:MAG: metal ABC transporter permease [Gammaproteobacteria bacterium]